MSEALEGFEVIESVDVVRLRALESLIDTHVRSFLAVGIALTAIRDEKLYQPAYPTFAAYCRARWGWSRNNAANYIAAAAVRMNCQALDIPTFSHALLLAPFSPEQQIEYAPQIAHLSYREAAKVTRRLRDKETNTNAISVAARAEIREALAGDVVPSEIVAFLRAATRLTICKQQFAHEDMIRVAEAIRSLVSWYNALRADRIRQPRA